MWRGSATQQLKTVRTDSKVICVGGGGVCIHRNATRQKQRNAETTFKQRDEIQKKSREMKDRFLTKKLKDSHFLNSNITTKANSQEVKTG